VGLLGQPGAEGTECFQHRAGRSGRLHGQGLDQHGQETADLGVTGHQALVVGIGRRAHQRRHRAHGPDDALPVFTQSAQDDGDRFLVVEGVEDGLHTGVQLSDGTVVVLQLAGPALLAPVGGGPLHVPEDDVEDVDDVVASAGPQPVGVGHQRRHPARRAQVGELGDPGILGVAGQAGDAPRRKT
jgi:hypothetical protein